MCNILPGIHWSGEPNSEGLVKAMLLQDVVGLACLFALVDFCTRIKLYNNGSSSEFKQIKQTRLLKDNS